jgi:hypothetical protein
MQKSALLRTTARNPQTRLQLLRTRMSGLLKRINMMSQFLDHLSDDIPPTLNESC